MDLGNPLNTYLPLVLRSTEYHSCDKTDRPVHSLFCRRDIPSSINPSRRLSHCDSMVCLASPVKEIFTTLRNNTAYLCQMEERRKLQSLDLFVDRGFPL